MKTRPLMPLTKSAYVLPPGEFMISPISTIGTAMGAQEPMRKVILDKDGDPIRRPIGFKLSP